MVFVANKRTNQLGFFDYVPERSLIPPMRITNHEQNRSEAFSTEVQLQSIYSYSGCQISQRLRGFLGLGQTLSWLGKKFSLR